MKRAVVFNIFFSLSISPTSRSSPIAGQELYANNNGISLHYRKHGAGPPLIFLHGFPDRETTWSTFQVPFFAQSHTVITPTIRGYPPSSVPPLAEDYEMPKLVSDLLAILDQEGIEKATIIGHDVGGAVAQFFALNHTQRVNALVAVNTPIIPRFFRLIEFDEGQQELARYTIDYINYKPSQPKNVSSIVEPIRNTTYRDEIAAYLQASPIDGMMHFYTENYPGPPYGQNLSLDGLVQRVPSMILWGEADQYFSAKMIDGLEGWFAEGVRLVTVPGAGHWVFRDAPERANAELKSFIETLGS